MVPLFDSQKIHAHRKQAAVYFNAYDFLARPIETELADRIQTLGTLFKTVLVNGARTDHLNQLAGSNQITFINAYQNQTDIYDYIDIDDLQYNCDLIVDCLKIQTIPDIQTYFKNIKGHLKPCGIFIAAFYGGETLRELRQSLLLSELNLYQSATLRVIPMIDMDTTLKLLLHSGFKNPVVDREILTITYPSLKRIFKDIRGMGESDPFTASPLPITHQHYKQTEHHYRSEYSDGDKTSLKVTVEVIYLKCENGE